MPYPNQQGRPEYRQQSRQKPEDKFNAELESNERLGNETIAEILKPLEQKGNYNLYIDNIKRYIEKDCKGVSSSQLRNIYSRVKKLKEYKELYVIRPKLAYLYGRAEKDEMKRMLTLLDNLIKKVDNNEKLEEFKNFFESIIAYHKYYGGKQ